MKIHQFSIPTPLYLGPVNVYLIEDEPLTLVDTGPRTDLALEALKDCFHTVGYRLEDLERIVLTHVHEDHSGLAATIQRVSGATIFAHPWESARLRGIDDYNLLVPLLERAGVPGYAIERCRKAYEVIRNLGEELEEVEGIEDGDLVDFARESFEIIHTPGHTPGSISLWRASDRSMIAADTVLKTITPNPVLSPDPIDPTRRFPSLCEYFVSLSRIRALSPTLVHGGHGADITDFEEHFTRIVRFNDERQRRLGEILNGHHMTAWEAAQRLFPNANAEHEFLAVSETVAQLDFGVAEARFAMDTLGEIETYAALRT